MERKAIINRPRNEGNGGRFAHSSVACELTGAGTFRWNPGPGSSNARLL